MYGKFEVTTESGAKYLYESTESQWRVQRKGPVSPYIDYASVPDSEWITLEKPTEDPSIGYSWVMYLAGGRCRITTPVVSIQDVNEW